MNLMFVHRTATGKSIQTNPTWPFHLSSYVGLGASNSTFYEY